MKTITLRRTLVTTAVVGVILCGHTRGEQANSPASAIATLSHPAAGPSSLPDFAAIVDQNGPAVVNIGISGNMKIAAPGVSRLDPDSPFSDVFGHFQAPSSQLEIPMRGLCSGFIVRPDGVILTNAHMVDGASEVTVKLTDRREFKAKVIGIDAPTDTAVLKIDAHDLPTVRIGDPSQTHVGEWVLAIGSPFGFANSVTAGIISAKSRFLPGEAYVPFIQTDVAVNPGNSGGPLFNTKGVVIGINSQIFSQTGGYQGLSFAIPIDIALRVEQQLLRDGKVSRGRLGVSTQDLNQPLADSFGLAKPAGALVDSVLSDGPADEAGLQPGDIILQLNDKDIQASYELPPQVAELTPGSQARLTLWRDGRSKEVTFRVGEMNTMAKIGETSEATEDRLGVAVRPLAPNELRQADVKVGLVVEQSVGPALRAGIQPGDAVLAVNGHPVADAEQLREFVEKANRHIALLVQRDRVRVFVPVDLDEVP